MRGSIGGPLTTHFKARLETSFIVAHAEKREEKRRKFWSNVDWNGIKARIEQKRRFGYEETESPSEAR